MSACAHGGTCPPSGCSLCRPSEPHLEPTEEDYCWPHPYYGDQWVDGAHSDLERIGRCYCGKQLYPAGGPK